MKRLFLTLVLLGLPVTVLAFHHRPVPTPTVVPMKFSHAIMLPSTAFVVQIQSATSMVCIEVSATVERCTRQ